MKLRTIVLILAIPVVIMGQDETPVKYSFMPKCVDIDSLVRKTVGDTSDIVDSTYNDFQSIALPDSGIFISFYGDTLLLPPGIVFSERKAALYVYFKSAWERQSVELYYMKMLVNTYCDKSKEAEVFYQIELDRLIKKNKRNWFERNAGYIGFGSAILVMAVRDIAIMELVK